MPPARRGPRRRGRARRRPRWRAPSPSACVGDVGGSACKCIGGPLCVQGTSQDGSPHARRHRRWRREPDICCRPGQKVPGWCHVSIDNPVSVYRLSVSHFLAVRLTRPSPPAGRSTPASRAPGRGRPPRATARSHLGPGHLHHGPRVRRSHEPLVVDGHELHVVDGAPLLHRPQRVERQPGEERVVVRSGQRRRRQQREGVEPDRPLVSSASNARPAAHCTRAHHCAWASAAVRCRTVWIPTISAPIAAERRDQRARASRRSRATARPPSPSPAPRHQPVIRPPVSMPVASVSGETVPQPVLRGARGGR